VTVPLFKRSQGNDDQAARVQAFWAWWTDARTTIETALDAKQLTPPLIDEMTRRTKAIDPGLGWEFGPGLTARFQLCVTAEGDIERRAIAEQWWRAAPPHANWNFFPARQAQPIGTNFTLTFDSRQFDPAALRFNTVVDHGHERINLSVWHPHYSSLDEGTRKQVTYLLLDGLLGEDGVERWCGTIETPVEGPLTDSVDAAGLQHQVEALAASATRERFVLGQKTSPDGRVRIVAMNAALKHIDHLDKPYRVRLVIHLVTAASTGLPDRDESAELEAFEDRVTRAMPEAVFAGRMTGAGTRTLNWYVSDAGSAKTAMDAVRGSGRWRTDLKVEADPRWQGLRDNLLD
jgi:hypothetical protein